MASRAQLVAEVIRPALAAGKTVVSDRFLLANVVYQGHAAGLDPAEIWQVGRVATQDTLPHLTFLLDLDVQQARQRLAGTLDRMESRGSSYLQRVRQGFLAEAAADPRRIIVLDATADIDTIQQQIRTHARSALRSHGHALAEP
jgi:dTMP kinase